MAASWNEGEDDEGSGLAAGVVDVDVVWAVVGVVGGRDVKKEVLRTSE